MTLNEGISLLPGTYWGSPPARDPPARDQELFLQHLSLKVNKKAKLKLITTISLLHVTTTKEKETPGTEAWIGSIGVSMSLSQSGC